MLTNIRIRVYIIRGIYTWIFDNLLNVLRNVKKFFDGFYTDLRLDVIRLTFFFFFFVERGQKYIFFIRAD